MNIILIFVLSFLCFKEILSRSVNNYGDITVDDRQVLNYQNMQSNSLESNTVYNLYFENFLIVFSKHFGDNFNMVLFSSNRYQKMSGNAETVCQLLRMERNL